MHGCTTGSGARGNSYSASWPFVTGSAWRAAPALRSSAARARRSSISMRWRRSLTPYFDLGLERRTDFYRIRVVVIGNRLVDLPTRFLERFGQYCPHSSHVRIHRSTSFSVVLELDRVEQRLDVGSGARHGRRLAAHDDFV